MQASPRSISTHACRCRNTIATQQRGAASARCMDHKQADRRRARARTARPRPAAPANDRESPPEIRNRSSERAQVEAIEANKPIGRNAKALPGGGIVSQGPGSPSNADMTNHIYSTKQSNKAAGFRPHGFTRTISGPEAGCGFAPRGPKETSRTASHRRDAPQGRSRPPR
jgi:hypothetical protein